MAEIIREVRFFEPFKVDVKDKRVRFDGDFWKDLATELSNTKDSDKKITHNGAEYFGNAKTATAPALNYVYVGRLRRRSEWPDTLDESSWTEGALNIGNPSVVLMEPTYLVPFGTNNYVAVMTPVHGGTRVSALDGWITGILGGAPKGERVELFPLINQKVQAALDAAQGATMLEFQILPHEEPPATGGGQIGDAAREATAKRVSDDLAIEMRYTFGHSIGDPAGRNALLEGARWVRQHTFSKRARTSILVPRTQGNDTVVRRERHELFDEKIAHTVKMTVDGENRPSEETVLKAVIEAIDKFRSQA